MSALERPQLVGVAQRRAPRPRVRRGKRRARARWNDARGSVLVIALIVLSLAAIVALAGARGNAFGLRIANAGVARLDLRAAADNALERALATAPPDGRADVAYEEPRDEHRIGVRVQRDRRLPLGMPPADGYSLGLGGAAFGAEHYTARADVRGPRGGTASAEQQFYLLVPEGP